MTPEGAGPMGRTGSKVPKGYKQFQIQKFTPEMMEQFQSLFGHVSPDSYLGKLAAGDQEAFAEMEAPALRQFSALQGNIGSRFAGMGQGGTKSSGFRNTMNQAGSDFAQDLQAKRMQTRKDSLAELMKFSEMLMGQQPYETGLVQKEQKQPGFLQSFGSALGGAIPGAIGGFMAGGPAGAALGAGSGFAGGFSGGQTSQSGGINPSMNFGV
jgi:hypothetical protein